MSRDAAGNEPTVCFPTSTKDGPCWGSTPRHRWCGGRALTACSRRAEMSVGCRGHAGPGQAPLLLWGLRKTRRLSKAVGPFPLGSLVGSGPFCRFRSDISNSPISCSVLHPRCCPRDATQTLGPSGLQPTRPLWGTRCAPCLPIIHIRRPVMNKGAQYPSESLRQVWGSFR